MVSISPRAARAVSYRVISTCFFTCSPFSAFTVFEVEHPDDPVGIPHDRNFGVGDDDSLVRLAHRQRRSPLDTRRAVADDPIEPGSQVGDDASDTLVRQSILAWFGCAAAYILQTLVANGALRKLCDALHHIE